MIENEEIKSLLMKVKEESEKAGLKLSIQKAKIMASGPTTSWQIDGRKLEEVGVGGAGGYGGVSVLRKSPQGPAQFQHLFYPFMSSCSHCYSLGLPIAYLVNN